MQDKDTTHNIIFLFLNRIHAEKVFGQWTCSDQMQEIDWVTKQMEQKNLGCYLQKNNFSSHC